LQLRRATFESGPFTDQEKLGFRCAERLHRSANEIDDNFYAELKKGFSDEQIVELIATASAFELFPSLRGCFAHSYDATSATEPKAGLMRPIASRISKMSGEGALSVFAHAKELERQGRSSFTSSWESRFSIQRRR